MDLRSVNEGLKLAGFKEGLRFRDALLMPYDRARLGLDPKSGLASLQVCARKHDCVPSISATVAAKLSAYPTSIAGFFAALAQVASCSVMN